MLNGRKIPRGMWGEMLKTAAYLINRSSSYAVGGMILYEKVKGTKSNLSHLKNPGSRAWVQISKE
jgi:hypothetical protein